MPKLAVVAGSSQIHEDMESARVVAIAPRPRSVRAAYDELLAPAWWSFV
jgi:hypothetical protein